MTVFFGVVIIIPTDGQMTVLFFQVVIMNFPKHPSSCQDLNRIIPTDGQTTVRFFSGHNYESAKSSEVMEPPETFPLTAR